jgi:hypothetical protein
MSSGYLLELTDTEFSRSRNPVTAMMHSIRHNEETAR